MKCQCLACTVEVDSGWCAKCVDAGCNCFPQTSEQFIAAIGSPRGWEDSYVSVSAPPCTRPAGVIHHGAVTDGVLTSRERAALWESTKGKR